MIFSNIEFFIFFGLFFVLHVVLRRQLTAHNVLVMVASYVFYAWWDTRFLALIVISTAMDYVMGFAVARGQTKLQDLIKAIALVAATVAAIAIRGVEDLGIVVGFSALFCVILIGLHVVLGALQPERRAHVAVIASVALNLGILGVFKYFNFFAASFADLAGNFGWTPGFVTLNVVLPVGISFYTFQTMSYTLDIYRGQLKPINRILPFAAFVAFFPQLVAGPIERARNLLPQFESVRELTLERLQSGAMLFLWGFYKKVVIADNLAPISDRIFSNPSAHSPDEILVGVLAFTFQIYGDFSGYSDMARGAARMLGFDLMLNFNMPYFSRTPSEFWRRWHISLSSWLRDYLYVPLGGNRSGAFGTYRNLMLTMLLGGLWHGSAWTFVAWGFFHGFILVVYRLLNLDKRLDAVSTGNPGGIAVHLTAMAAMFVFAVISWVFFRAGTFDDAFYILGHMHVIAWNSDMARLLFLISPLLVLEAAARLTDRINIWDRMPKFVTVNIVLFLLCASVFLAATARQDFIYFDF